MKKILFSILIPGVFCAQTGNVGINTSTPKANLQVLGNLRLEHPSAGQGKIARVYKDGSIKWATAVPLPVLGSFTRQVGYNDATITTPKFFNARITLNPGKWIVKLSMLISVQNVYSDQSNIEGYFVQTYFSDSSTNAARTADYVPGSSTAISGSHSDPSGYGMVVGSVLLQNQTSVPKTYYLWGTAVKVPSTNSSNLALYKLTDGDWSENRIYAIPIE